MSFGDWHTYDVKRPRTLMETEIDAAWRREAERITAEREASANSVYPRDSLSDSAKRGCQKVQSALLTVVGWLAYPIDREDWL